VGKAERQIGAQEKFGGLQENHWSPANECSDAEEIVGDDEGAVGGAEGLGLPTATCGDGIVLVCRWLSGDGPSSWGLVAIKRGRAFKKLNHISSVSGGSITAEMLGLKWNDFIFNARGMSKSAQLRKRRLDS
jgi:hypothetical protein